LQTAEKQGQTASTSVAQVKLESIEEKLAGKAAEESTEIAACGRGVGSMFNYSLDCKAFGSNHC
jgi:hypothetical protein